MDIVTDKLCFESNTDAIWEYIQHLFMSVLGQKLLVS